MDYMEIINRITHRLDTKPASAFFINGAPGTGKSYLQQRLADNLCQLMPRAMVLGPYKIGVNDCFGAQMLNELFDLRYISTIPDLGVVNDLNNTWHWLKDNLEVSSRQTFIILIDLENPSWDDYDLLRIWFSSTRYLEHIWDLSSARLCVVITGFWDHPGLKTLYNQYMLSFPYTISQNYLVWEGIPLSSSLELLGNNHQDDPIQILYGKLLHEIAGGNPTIMLDLIDHLDANDHSVSAILTATQKAVLMGSAAQTFLSIWKKLPLDSIRAIKELLLLRQVPVKSLSASLEQLLISGILSERIILNQRYVTLRSWYVEVLLRLHAGELGLDDTKLYNLDLANLVPSIKTLHQEAYILIHEIENLLRNYLATHLGVGQPDGKSLLSERCYREILVYKSGKSMKAEQDAQERAELWRSRSQEHGLTVSLNPDIAYLSLSDLGGIIKELGASNESKCWNRVATAVERVVYIRDAVMHNQIIEISDLQKIYDLQIEIFTALSETSQSFRGSN